MRLSRGFGSALTPCDDPTPIEGAEVRLRPASAAPTARPLVRLLTLRGEPALLDSLPPGGYRLAVRRVGCKLLEDHALILVA